MAEPFIPALLGAHAGPPLSFGDSKMAKSPASSVLVAPGDREPPRGCFRRAEEKGCPLPPPLPASGAVEGTCWWVVLSDLWSLSYLQPPSVLRLTTEHLLSMSCVCVPLTRGQSIRPRLPSLQASGRAAGALLRASSAALAVACVAWARLCFLLCKMADSVSWVLSHSCPV